VDEEPRQAMAEGVNKPKKASAAFTGLFRLLHAGFWVVYVSCIVTLSRLNYVDYQTFP
jgi:hypothetical protein